MKLVMVKVSEALIEDLAEVYNMFPIKRWKREDGLWNALFVADNHFDPEHPETGEITIDNSAIDDIAIPEGSFRIERKPNLKTGKSDFSLTWSKV